MRPFRRLYFIFFAPLILCATCGREGLPSSVMEKVREAHERWLVVDACRVAPVHPQAAEEADWHDIRRLRRAGFDAVVLMISIPRLSPGPDGYAEARETAVRAIEAVRQEAVDHGGEIGLALSPQDAYGLEKEGKFALIVGLAGAHALGPDGSLAALYHSLGVRVLALGGAVEDDARDRAAVVAECNRAGIVIDVSGCSDRSVRDVLAASEAPVIASHSLSRRALGDDPPGLSDETILTLAEKGGILNILPVRGNRSGSVFPSFRKRPSAAEAAADEIDRLRKLVGLERIGIGTGPRAGGGSEDRENPSWAIGLTVELLRRGWDEIMLEKMWGGNFMGVLARARQVSEDLKSRRPPDAAGNAGDSPPGKRPGHVQGDAG
jgi:membrane dipeptidase